MKKAIEYMLFDSGISNYQISKATGISAVVLGKYTNGKSDVGKMTLDNAERIYAYFREFLTSAEKAHGSVTGGATYILLQDAYLDYIDRRIEGGTKLEGNFYRAAAIDADGRQYDVIWLPVEGYESLEDGNDHCDWDRPHWVIPV